MDEWGYPQETVFQFILGRQGPHDVKPGVVDSGVVTRTLIATVRYTMAAKVRTGVVGAGLAATVFHIPLLLSLPELYVVQAVVERTPPAEVQPEGTIARKFGINTKLYHAFNELLEDPEVELVSLLAQGRSDYSIRSRSLLRPQMRLTISLAK